MSTTLFEMDSLIVTRASNGRGNGTRVEICSGAGYPVALDSDEAFRLGATLMMHAMQEILRSDSGKDGE